MTTKIGRKPGSHWLPGLDGLRALAVTAVVVYHFNPRLLPGGFLGVDLFFAISGYLITRLLLNQINDAGRLDIVGFYRRRVRRLVPAVVVLAGAVVLVDLLFWRDELATLRSSVVSAVLFTANWWLIGAKQSYFVASGRPSMLQHLWSLAIEEQFYLVWPLMLCVVIAPTLLLRRHQVVVLRPRMLTRLALFALLLGLLSTLTMAALAVRGDVPYGSDSSRIYFGTDTHSMGLLLGAAMGALATRSTLPGARRSRLLRGAFLTDIAAVIALLAMTRALVEVNEFQPGLYRGGFLAFSVGAVIVVSTVVRRGSLVGWLLERPLMRWIGQRSYSIYLWHWPVAVVTRPGVDVSWPPVPLFAARIAVTLLLAEASYRFVEVPARSGAIKRLLARFSSDAVDQPSTARTVRRRALPAAAFIGLLTFSTLSSSLAYSSPSNGEPRALGVVATPSADANGAVPARGYRAGRGATPFPLNVSASAMAGPSAGPPTAAPTGYGLAAPASGTSLSPAATPAPVVSPSPVPTPVPAPAPPRTVAGVSAFGDSVMLGAAPALRSCFPGIDVHAVEGRQARAVFADIVADRAAGKLAPDVIIQTGDNGIVSPADLTATLNQLRDRARVVLVTDRVPKNWQDPNNSVIRHVAAGYANVVVADWFALSNSHADWFYKDGLHLPPPGAAQYAALIGGALRHP